MTPAVDVEVARDRLPPIGLGQDDRNRAPIGQFGPQPIDIEGFVSQECPEVLNPFRDIPIVTLATFVQGVTR